HRNPGEWLRRTEPIPPVYIDSDTLMISTPVSERHGPFTSQNDDDPGTDAAPPFKGTDYRWSIPPNAGGHETHARPLDPFSGGRSRELARFGRIDRSVERSPCARRCR